MSGWIQRMLRLNATQVLRLKPETTVVAPAMIAIALVAVVALGTRLPVRAAESAREVPPPASDLAPGNQTSDVTVLAGGCFWGVQGVFQHVNGVTAAVSGYAGGDKYHADYETVSLGGSGHAESVQITFDPRVVTYGKLLQIFFSVVHDPTQLNRQGPDTGTQYRSAIFPANAEQSRVARAYIDQLNQAKVFNRALATKIEEGKTFYPAERYHQDFLTNNPTYPYIAINDLPKLEDLKRLFSTMYRKTPVLVLKKTS